MKPKITIVALSLAICQGLCAQPLVYSSENTGAACTPPPLPAFSALPRIEPLPDPFLWANGSGRSTSFSDWECHRNEFKKQIENYEIGIKPPKPDTLTASYAPSSATAGVLTVVVKRNGQTLTLTSQVALPAVAGPWPAIIGMNSPSGSVPTTVFSNRNIARITYNHNNVTTYGGPSLNDPFYKLYPEYNLVNAGQYSAWAWGVSRIIDGLELVQASLPIKLDKIGVTGCSYAGKMALFSGAFDERIALTIAQESGGGGAPAWRVSETLGAVEKLGATDYTWFRDSMRLFAGENVPKLPHDHHELMAMVAPRALLVTGNTDFEWLANPATYVSARATKSIYNTLGISERFGFYIDGGHNHCAVPNSQVPAMQAFVDKYLADIPNVNTDTITINPYPNMNYLRWYQWWGTGNPVLPPLPPDPPVKGIFMEAECATVGSSWSLVTTDTLASNGKYVVVNGLNSTATAPVGAAAAVVFTFNVDSVANYNFVARINCPTGDDDSYWIKIDNGAFATVNNLGTAGWQWVKLTNGTLSVGQHTFTIAYREDGAKLDKLVVTTSNAAIPGKGQFGVNCCPPPTTRLYVYDSASGGNGASWDCAYDKLSKAVEYANSHPEIKEVWIAKGMYTPLNNGNRNNRFDINRGDLKIIGGFTPGATDESQANPVDNPTIISGDVGVTGDASDNSFNLFYIHNMYSNTLPLLLLKGLILEKANGSSGGAILMEYVNNTRLEDCVIRQNTVSGAGGAVYLDNSALAFVNCTIENNTASSGGGVFGFQSSPTFRKTAFRGNTANSGGAFYGNYGSPMFRDVVFTGNTAQYGGATYHNVMDADYMNTVFHNNGAARQGAAVYVHNGKAANLLNCTLYGNATNGVDGDGGTVFAGYNGATVKAYNTIFWNNTRGGSSTAARADYHSGGGNPPTFRNCMLQANSVVDADNGTTLLNNIRGVAPAFMNAGNVTGADGKWYTADDGLQLVCGSAPSLVEPVICGAGINSGDNTIVSSNSLTTDIMGNTRTVCSVVDRGAYELQACNTSTYTVSAVTIDKSLMAQGNTELVANPFSSQLQVRYAGKARASISIVDAAGKVVAQKGNVSAGTHSFNAATWGTGLYNVVVVPETGKKMNFKAIKL